MPAKKKVVAKKRPVAAKKSSPVAVKRLTSEQIQQRLAEVARIGSLFIEGEDVLNALTPAAQTWAIGDDINYDAAVAVPLKKNLLRIEKIERDFPVYAIVWRRRPDDPGKVEVIMAGRMNSSFDLGKGKCPAMFPAIRQVFDKGKATFVAKADDVFETSSTFRYGHAWIAHTDCLLRTGKRIISCFHPVRDSREQVVAALEVTCVGTDG